MIYGDRTGLMGVHENIIDRNIEYQRRWAFYKGEMYSGEAGREYAKEHKLFKHMREVFNCITQAVDADARFVMKEVLRFNCEDEKHSDLLDQIWKFSNIQSHKYKLVKYGANLGDCYIEVRELPQKPWARLIVLNSEDMWINYNPHDQELMDSAHQTYIFWDAQAKKHKRWHRIWYSDRIETYIDERLVEEFSMPHNFGQVPIVHIKFLDIGEAQGLHTWHNVQSQVDAVNELGSYVSQILYRYADPTLIANGPNKPEKLVKGDGNIFFVGMEGDLRMLEYSGNVLPNALQFIQDLKADIHNSLPELSLAKIQTIGQLSGYAVSLYLADLLAKIDEVRGNFANGIEWASALALKVANKSSLAVDEFDSEIVFESALPEDLVEKWNHYSTKIGLGVESRRGIMKAEGLTEEEIEEKLAEIKAEMEESMDSRYRERTYRELDGLDFDFGLEDIER